MDDVVPFLNAWADAHTEFLQALGAGLIGVLIPLVVGAPRVLMHLGSITWFGGRFRPFSPNWLTVISLIGTLAGAALYGLELVVFAIFVASFAGILDRLDGRMAHVRGKKLSEPATWKDGTGQWQATVTNADKSQWFVRCGSSRWSRLMLEMNFDGETDLGKVLDPFADKVKIFVILTGFAFTGLVQPLLIVALAAPEVLGTLMRRPFYWHKKRQRGSGATWMGKFKAVMQWVTIIVMIQFHRDWLTENWSLTEQQHLIAGLMIACIVFAWASIYTRFTGKSVFSPVSRLFERLFSH